MSARPGRNDPCPCGSGTKYKKCCANASASPASASGVELPSDRATALHALDGSLVERMHAFATRMEGWEPEEDFPIDVVTFPEAELFLDTWAVYEYAGYAPGDRTIRERFLEGRCFELRTNEIAWLEAQGRAWLTAWEVVSVVPGASVVVRDLFTGEERNVIERLASESLVARDVLLGRVVDHEGLSLFCGLHPLPLAPRDGAAVVDIVRKELSGRRNGRLTVEDLRMPEVATLLIGAWEVIWHQVANRRPPALHNTDGEPLVMVREELTVIGALAAVRQRLLALPGATLDDEADDDGNEAIVFVRENPHGSQLENTVTGRVVLAKKALALETNSLDRATKLRKDVERACAGMVRYHSRTELDGAELVQQASGAGAAASGRRRPRDRRPSAPPELRATLQQMKTQQYERWCDLTIPALGGLTPRQAAESRSKRVRDELALILKEIERSEAMVPSDEAFDVDVIRHELGLLGAKGKKATRGVAR